MAWYIRCDICRDNLTSNDLKLYLNYYKEHGSHWVLGDYPHYQNGDSDNDSSDDDDENPKFIKSNFDKVHDLMVPFLCEKHWCVCMPDQKPWSWSETCKDCNVTVCKECKCGDKYDPYCNECWDKYERCDECKQTLFRINGPHSSECSKKL
jgi:hypothetical protein